MNIPEHREWLSYKEAQLVSGYGRTTLWKLVEAGSIPAVREGRSVRISRRGLDEYMWSRVPRVPEGRNAALSGGRGSQRSGE